MVLHLQFGLRSPTPVAKIPLKKWDAALMTVAVQLHSPGRQVMLVLAPNQQRRAERIPPASDAHSSRNKSSAISPILLSAKLAFSFMPDQGDRRR